MNLERTTLGEYLGLITQIQRPNELIYTYPIETDGCDVFKFILPIGRDLIIGPTIYNGKLFTHAMIAQAVGVEPTSVIGGYAIPEVGTFTVHPHPSSSVPRLNQSLWGGIVKRCERTGLYILKPE